MFEIFQKYLHSKGAFTDEDIAMIAAKSFHKRLRRRQYLLQEGDVWKHYAFVCRGCLRSYRVNDRGDEHILKFSVENWWAGDRESLLTGKPSQYNIEAMEDSELIMFTKEDFEMLCKQIPAFGEMVNLLVHRSYIASQNRVHADISYSSEEKYFRFIEQYPEIFKRVPLHMIASYLGISPETLSRIRAQATRR